MSRYEVDTDDEYEEQLRLCRAEGHDFEVGWDAIADREMLTCSRCGMVLLEQDR
jgi:hypothetical protein